MFKNFPVTVDTAQKSKLSNISVNSNDLNTLKLSITINQFDKPIDLTDATVRIAIVKPDNKTVFQDCTITDPTIGICEVVLETQAFIVAGVYIAEVMIYYGTDKIAVTGRFSYSVSKGILDNSTLESTNDWQSINQAIANAEGILNDLRENGTAIDAQARAEIETVTTQLADTASMKINMASFKRLAPEMKDTGRAQRAIDSAPEYATIVFENDKIYDLSGLVITKSLNIDLNGCKITADITDVNGNGNPLFWFKGFEDTSTSSVINTTTENETFVMLPTVSDTSRFSVGDNVLIKDNKVTQPWDNGAMGGVSYSDRNEINTITAIDTVTGKISLSSPLEWSYNTTPKMVKINLLKQPSVLGSASTISEVDPGVEYPGTSMTGAVPHIIHFQYCVNPHVSRVTFNKWQLHAVNFNYCINPVVESCVAESPFRISKGGHGYFMRFEYCRSGLATKNTTRKTRHTVDYVQSYDSQSSFNVSIDCQYGSYMLHGMGSKRCKSLNDIAVGGGYGWVMGNPTFNADYDYEVVNPTYIGNSDVFFMCSLSERLRITNPTIKTSARAFFMHTGAKELEVHGGDVFLTPNTTKYESVLARSKSGAGDSFGLAPLDIKLDNVKFRGRSILFFDILGSIDINNCKFENNDGTVTVIRITNGNIPTNLRLKNNDIRGSHSISINNDVAPTGVYELVGNTTKDNTYTSPIYIFAANNLKATGNNFIGATSIAWRGDINAAVNGGAVIRDNTPIISNRGYATSISSIPLYVGQEALVNGVFYKAVGTTVTSDWKMITN